jgi:hypothetical protein
LSYGHNVSKTDLLRAALCAPDDNDDSSNGSGGSGAGEAKEEMTQGHNAAAGPEPAETVAGLTVEEMVRQLMVESGNPPHAHLLDLLVRQKMDPYTKAIVISPPSRSNRFDGYSPPPSPPPQQRWQAEEELVGGKYGSGPADAEGGAHGVYNHDYHDGYHDNYGEDVDGPRVIALAHGPWPTARAFADATSADEVVRIVMAAPAGAGRLRARLQMVEQRAVAMALRRLRQQQQKGTDSHALLAALNAVTAVLRRHDMPVSRGLCELGLELSAELQNSVALRRYLMDSESGGHLFTAKLWERVLDDLVSPLVSSRPRPSLGESGVAQAKPTGKRRHQQQQLQQQQQLAHQQQLLGAARVGSWQRRDVLQLLTGGQAAEVGADGSATSEPCIARCIDPDCPRSVEVYVRALQKLGAVSSIHSYWLTIRARLLDAAAAAQKAAAPAAATEQHMAANAAAFALIFARALAGAGDRAGAVRLLLTAPPPQPPPPLLDYDAQNPLQSPATVAAEAAGAVGAAGAVRHLQRQQQQQALALATLARLDRFLCLVHPLYASLSAPERDVFLLAQPWSLSSSPSSSSSSSPSSSLLPPSLPEVTLRSASGRGGGAATTTTTTTPTTVNGMAITTAAAMAKGKGDEKQKEKMRTRKKKSVEKSGAAPGDDNDNGNDNDKNGDDNDDDGDDGVALAATATASASAPATAAASAALTRQLLQSFERLLRLRWGA